MEKTGPARVRPQQAWVRGFICVVMCLCVWGGLCLCSLFMCVDVGLRVCLCGAWFFFMFMCVCELLCACGLVCVWGQAVCVGMR